MNKRFNYKYLNKTDNKDNYLNNSLFAHHPPQDNMNNIYFKYDSEKIQLNHYFVRDVTKLYREIARVPTAYLNYFEIITLQHTTKFAVDIDIHKSKHTNLWNKETEIVDETIRAIQYALREVGITESLIEGEHYMVCTSHGAEKQSIHIILYAWHFESMEYSKLFYNLIIKNVDPIISTVIDKSVYKKTQLFRMIWSCKPGTDRHKCPRENNGTIILNFDMFKKSILSYTKDSVLIEISQPEEILFSPTTSRQDKYKPTATTVSLSEDIINKISSIFCESLPSLNDVYSFPKPHNDVQNIVTDCIIPLGRLKSAMCPLCERVHEHDNGYISVKRIDDTSGNLMFSCRRCKTSTSSESRIYFGSFRLEINATEPDIPQLGFDEEKVLQIFNKRIPDAAEYTVTARTFMQLILTKTDNTNAKIIINQGAILFMYKNKSTFLGYAYIPKNLMYLQPTFNETLNKSHITQGDMSKLLTKGNTIALRSPMGSGKTTAVLDFAINSLQRIIIVCCRETVGRDTYNRIRRKYIQPYLDMDPKYLTPEQRAIINFYGESTIFYKDAHPFELLTANILVIQAESLYKLLDPYNPTAIPLFTCIYYDEAEALNDQLQSEQTMGDNIRDCTFVFGYLIKHCKYVVATDCYLGARTHAILSKIRGDVYTVDNLYPAPERTAYFINSYGGLLAKMDEYLANGKKIAFYCESKKKLEALGKVLRTKYGEPAIRTYTADSSKEDKLELGDMNKYWGAPTVRFAGYTSLMTVGSNMDLKDCFDAIFCFANANSNARTVSQAISRVRHPKDNALYYHVKQCYKDNDTMSFGAKITGIPKKLHKARLRVIEIVNTTMQASPGVRDDWVGDVSKQIDDNIPSWMLINYAYAAQEAWVNREFYLDTVKYFLSLSNYKPVDYIPVHVPEVDTAFPFPVEEIPDYPYEDITAVGDLDKKELLSKLDEPTKLKLWYESNVDILLHLRNFGYITVNQRLSLEKMYFLRVVSLEALIDMQSNLFSKWVTENGRDWLYLLKYIKSYGSDFLAKYIKLKRFWTVYSQRNLKRLHWFKEVSDRIGIDLTKLDQDQIITIEGYDVAAKFVDDNIVEIKTDFSGKSKAKSDICYSHIKLILSFVTGTKLSKKSYNIKSKNVTKNAIKHYLVSSIPEFKHIIIF